MVGIDEARGRDFAGYASYLKEHAGDSVTLTVLREDDMLLEIGLPVSDEGTIGVMRRNPFTLSTHRYTFLEAIPAGFRKAGDVIASYWDQLKMIVQPKTKMYEELGGFLAIGSIFPSEWDWQDFWYKTAFLSIILAVMNILPIPGLDGGHAIFTFWEIVTGRKERDKGAGPHSAAAALRQRQRYLPLLPQIAPRAVRLPEPVRPAAGPGIP